MLHVDREDCCLAAEGESPEFAVRLYSLRELDLTVGAFSASKEWAKLDKSDPRTKGSVTLDTFCLFGGRFYKEKKCNHLNSPFLQGRSPGLKEQVSYCNLAMDANYAGQSAILKLASHY